MIRLHIDIRWLPHIGAHTHVWEGDHGVSYCSCVGHLTSMLSLLQSFLVWPTWVRRICHNVWQSFCDLITVNVASCFSRTFLSSLIFERWPFWTSNAVHQSSRRQYYLNIGRRGLTTICHSLPWPRPSKLATSIWTLVVSVTVMATSRETKLHLEV